MRTAPGSVELRFAGADFLADVGRAELAAKEKQEIVVLESFLPKQLSAEELEKLVREAIAADMTAAPDAAMAASIAMKVPIWLRSMRPSALTIGATMAPVASRCMP